MYESSEKRLLRLQQAGQAELLKGGLIGLEKEGLRVSPSGCISQQPHPTGLGSPLTNRYITTDYSEALTEIITPPSGDRSEPLRFLFDAHYYLYQHLGEEILWSSSMPCVVEGDKNIPIADYGNSNAGMMKTVYRRGLGHRYGRVMQVIAGVHFNYSIPRDFWPALQAMERDERPLQSFISESYFGMLRNLQRFGWLIPYLFGASPSVCKSFLGGRPTNLREFDENTYYSPYATSLRMGDIGYQNSKEEGTGIKACYNSLDAYVQTLSCAIETLCPIYQAIGVKVDGEYRQLNANILQIENEYYSTVRPKQVPELMEKPIHALQRRGVRYVELRSLDVNPYHPLGIAEEQIYFLEALMILSLLETSPEFDVAEQKEIDWNELAAAHRGRDPALRLKLRGDEIGLRDWGLEICDAMEPIVELLDDAMATSPYRNSLQIQRERLEHSDMTPSAIMLAEMRERGEGFYHFAKRKSLEHYDYFMQHDHSSEDQDLLECEATDSWRRQREMEKADNLSFDQFLSNYFSQQL